MRPGGIYFQSGSGGFRSSRLSGGAATRVTGARYPRRINALRACELACPPPSGMPPRTREDAAHRCDQGQPGRNDSPRNRRAVSRKTGKIGFDLLLFRNGQAAAPPHIPQRRFGVALLPRSRRDSGAWPAHGCRVSVAWASRVRRVGVASASRVRRVFGAYPSPGRRLAGASAAKSHLLRKKSPFRVKRVNRPE